MDKVKTILVGLKVCLGGLWTTINGKKRKIAMFYWGTVIPLVPIFQIPVTGTAMKIIAGIGAALTALGYGHSIVKPAEGQEAQEAQEGQ